MKKEVENLLSKFEGELFIEVYKNDNSYEQVMSGSMNKKQFTETLEDFEVEGVEDELLYLKADSKSYIYVIDGMPADKRKTEEAVN